MGHHKVYIGTVEYPWSYLKYKRSFSIEAQKFVVKIPNLESFTTGTDVIKITRDGTLVAEGILALGSWEVGDNVVTVLSSYGYRRKLQMLLGVFTAPATEAATHILNQLADTGLHDDTLNNYGVITVDYGATSNAYFDRRRVIEDVLFMTGWEFRTDPDGGCDFKAQCGTDLSATIRFSREEGTLKGWDVDYVENGMQTVEKVTVIGEGVGTYQAYGSAQGGGYAAGDAMKTINRKSLVNNLLCGTAAAALLADMDHILKYGVANVVNVNTGFAFDVFDKVNIVDEQLGIDEDLRVASITVEDYADGVESTQIELCNIDHLQTSGEMLIGDVRGRVEDDFSRTHQPPAIDRVVIATGESETGYTITENGGSAVTVEKDLFTLSSGAAAGDDCYIETPEDQIDFAKKPYLVCRWEINNVDVDGSISFVGLVDSLLLKIIGFSSVGDELYAHSINPPSAANRTKILDPIVVDTQYLLEVYCKNGLAYFYINGVLVTTHGAGVTANPIPTAGEVKALYSAVSNDAADVDVILKVWNYRVRLEW